MKISKSVKKIISSLLALIFLGILIVYASRDRSGKGKQEIKNKNQYEKEKPEKREKKVNSMKQSRIAVDVRSARRIPEFPELDLVLGEIYLENPDPEINSNLVVQELKKLGKRDTIGDGRSVHCKLLLYGSIPDEHDTCKIYSMSSDSHITMVVHIYGKFNYRTFKKQARKEFQEILARDKEQSALVLPKTLFLYFVSKFQSAAQSQFIGIFDISA